MCSRCMTRLLQVTMTSRRSDGHTSLKEVGQHTECREHGTALLRHHLWKLDVSRLDISDRAGTARMAFRLCWCAGLQNYN